MHRLNVHFLVLFSLQFLRNYFYQTIYHLLVTEIWILLTLDRVLSYLILLFNILHPSLISSLSYFTFLKLLSFFFSFWLLNISITQYKCLWITNIHLCKHECTHSTYKYSWPWNTSGFQVTNPYTIRIPNITFDSPKT